MKVVYLAIDLGTERVSPEVLSGKHQSDHGTHYQQDDSHAPTGVSCNYLGDSPDTGFEVGDRGLHEWC